MGIRDYIKLVEALFDEGWFSKPEPDINARIYGRKEPKTFPMPVRTAVAQKIAEPREPTDPAQIEALDTARRFSSADAYAYDTGVNRYSPTRSFDSHQVKRAEAEEAARLKSLWNFWKQQGYIK